MNAIHPRFAERRALVEYQHQLDSHTQNVPPPSASEPDLLAVFVLFALPGLEAAAVLWFGWRILR